MSSKKLEASSPTGQSLERQIGTLKEPIISATPFSCHLNTHCLVTSILYFHSRKYLTQLHSAPADANAVDALATVYHTLLYATLTLWSPEHPLTPTGFAAFVKSMLLSLPSSSQDAPSPAATALGELLVDTMWSIDSQLDDVIADSKAIVSAQSEREKEKEQVNGRAEESGAVLNRDAATKDKTTLLEVVKLLLVRQLVFCS
jgi:THO complex subunit 2